MKRENEVDKLNEEIKQLNKLFEDCIQYIGKSSEDSLSEEAMVRISNLYLELVKILGLLINSTIIILEQEKVEYLKQIEKVMDLLNSDNSCQIE